MSGLGPGIGFGVGVRGWCHLRKAMRSRPDASILIRMNQTTHKVKATVRERLPADRLHTLEHPMRGGLSSIAVGYNGGADLLGLLAVKRPAAHTHTHTRIKRGE